MLRDASSVIYLMTPSVSTPTIIVAISLVLDRATDSYITSFALSYPLLHLCVYAKCVIAIAKHSSGVVDLLTCSTSLLYILSFPYRLDKYPYIRSRNEPGCISNIPSSSHPLALPHVIYIYLCVYATYVTAIAKHSNGVVDLMTPSTSI